MTKGRCDREERQQQFLEEVRRLGTLSAGARAAKVSRRTARSWIERDLELRQQYEEALAEFRDSLEERLMERIEAGNGVSLRFKMKGEMPEKYGDGPRRGAEQEAGASARWEELEKAAREEGDG